MEKCLLFKGRKTSVLETRGKDLGFEDVDVHVAAEAGGVMRRDRNDVGSVILLRSIRLTARVLRFFAIAGGPKGVSCRESGAIARNATPYARQGIGEPKNKDQ